MSWSGRRQLIIILLVLIFIGGPISYGLYKTLSRPPICFDNKKNGDELGVDCGGSCSLFCPQQKSDPLVLWSRFQRVTDRVYNVVAYIENQNSDALATDVPYTFTLYDAQNIPIATREGTTFINPNGRQPIFESGIDVGKKVPAFVRFAWNGVPAWHKTTINPGILPIEIGDVRATDIDTLPRVTSRITNRGTTTLPPGEVIIFVYDEEDNVRAFSKTLLDPLKYNQSQPVVFSWPQGFGTGKFRYQIIPVINAVTLNPVNYAK